MVKKKQRSHGEMVEMVDGRKIKTESLNHKETLRATALAQAIGYYINTIVKDGDLYREMMRENRVLKPTTYMGVIEVALAFEAYLGGELTKDVESISAVVEELQPIKEAVSEAQRDAETLVDSQQP